MAKISTADCKKFLVGVTSPFLSRSEKITGLSASSEWIRIRKYKDANGIVCRDMANTGVPVVFVLAEDNGRLVLKRERALCIWEKTFETRFPDAGDEDWYDTWEETVMWLSLRAEDFAFGFGNDGGDIYYFFQPVTAHEGYDQHSPIDFLFPRNISGGEMCESTFDFGGDVTADLIAVGFIHDKKLNDMSGS
jgi:hypothetical protein